MKRSKWALLLAALLCIVQAVMPMTVFAFTAQTPDPCARDRRGGNGLHQSGHGAGFQQLYLLRYG